MKLNKSEAIMLNLDKTKRAEVEGFLKTIGITGSCDVNHFSDLKVVKDIYDDIANDVIKIKEIGELIGEIEDRILTDKDREAETYLYFNYLDTNFDGSNEESVEKANNKLYQKAIY